MKNSKKYVLIVAGGTGNRMKSAVPKQFLLINGKPLLLYTFDAFLKFDGNCNFVLVLPQDEIGYWEQLIKSYSFTLPHKIAIGGATRFESVRNGLNQIPDDGIVFIHDGVRPMVSQQTIRNCYHGTLEKGNALPVIAPSESIREVEGDISRAVDRSRYFLVQTPQTFYIPHIKRAYQQPFIEKFTDDASVFESNGMKINMVEGNRENIKITYSEDLKIAESLIGKI